MHSLSELRSYKKAPKIVVLVLLSAFLLLFRDSHLLRFLVLKEDGTYDVPEEEDAIARIWQYLVALMHIGGSVRLLRLSI